MRTYSVMIMRGGTTVAPLIKNVSEGITRISLTRDASGIWRCAFVVEAMNKAAAIEQAERELWTLSPILAAQFLDPLTPDREDPPDEDND